MSSTRTPQRAEPTPITGASRRYPGDLQAPGEARMLARAQLAVWGLPELASDAEYVVSELVTNAVAHAGGGDIWVALKLTPWHVVVQVTDQSPSPPALRPGPGPGGEAGRGLHIVAELSEEWGWHPSQVPGWKKVVYARIAR